MTERSLSDALERGLSALLAGERPPSDDAELAGLLGLAQELRGFPRENFRARLKTELVGSADLIMKMEEDTMTTTTEVTPVPKGYHTVTPYLVVRDAARLVEFAKLAFGAEEQFRTTGSAGGLHVEVRIGDSMVMMGGSPEMPSREQPSALHVYVDDVDAAYERALRAGAASIMPPADREYGDRDASVQDAFGNRWYIATHLGAAGPVPEGMRNVSLYLSPRGTSSLIEFLRRALGAEEVARYQSPEGVVHHAKLRIGDSIVEMADAHGPFGPMPSMVYLYVEDVDALYARAVEAGATAMEAPADQPYGDRTAHVKDPEGNSWYIATHVRDMG
jgi:PhnB protein